VHFTGSQYNAGMKLLMCVIMACLAAGCSSKSSPLAAESSPTRLPLPKKVSLSGVFTVPPKSSPVLEVYPPGEVQRIGLSGPLISNLREGDAIYVEGVVRTYLYKGQSKSPREPFWNVWIEVTKLKYLVSPRDVLR
jgi:hypothetical protein